LSIHVQNFGSIISKDKRDIEYIDLQSEDFESILCIPISLHGETIGVFYLDNQLSNSVFTTGDFDLLKVFMAQIAIIIENANLYNKNSNFKKLQKELLKLQSSLNSNDVCKKKKNDKISDILIYLNNNFTHPYDRKDLAKKFNLNENYMPQLFKNKTGISISEFINKKRIDAAKKLIAKNESKIIDIAYHVGFDNYSFFYRSFKKYTKLKPIEYKNLNNNLS